MTRFWLACIAVTLAGLAPAADPIRLDPIQVSPRVWYFRGESGVASAANKGFMSNAGFVVTSDGVVVFDALGTPALGEAMLAAIRRVTKQPVRRVVVSHYHADHVYGLEPLKKAGADIWAHARGREYLESDVSRQRLEQRKQALAPWVNAHTKILSADRWLDGDATFSFGGVSFDILYVGTSHAAEDVMMFVREEGVLFAGDLFFSGRIPFVGNADSKGWLKALERMLAIKPKVVIPGHGNASSDPQKDLELTRDYLVFLREKMGAAVKNLETFDEAYVATDWSRYKDLPAFDAANRINAYGTYLLMEQEALKQ